MLLLVGSSTNVMRLLYSLGYLYVLISGVILGLHISEKHIYDAHGMEVTESRFSSAAGWFAEIKPYCNSIEVESKMALFPPPDTTDGAGYSAACFALAGKIDRASNIIRQLPEDKRTHAAEIVLKIAHPVADEGDDKSVGPVMKLVLEFVPGNAMALYHVGMSEFNLGHNEEARDYLNRFLKVHTYRDTWQESARDALKRIE